MRCLYVCKTHAVAMAICQRQKRKICHYFAAETGMPIACRTKSKTLTVHVLLILGSVKYFARKVTPPVIHHRIQFDTVLCCLVNISFEANILPYVS